MSKAAFRTRRIDRAIGVTLSFALLAMALTGAMAAQTPAGPAAAISSPAHSAVITGNTATVTVLFDAGSDAKVTAAELYVDGELHDSVPVSPPVASGSCKLSWRCGDYAAGTHTLTARVYDSTGHSRAVDVEVMLQTAAKRGDGDAVRVDIIAPAEGQEIAGLTNVRISTDESRVRYVMLLIDDVFVALTNMPPYTFSLNTGRYLNGPHALRATAFDLSDNPNDSPTITVIINNPGGRTEMQSPAAAAPTEPKATIAQPAEPAAKTTEVPPQAPAAATKPIETAAGAAPPQTVAADSEPAKGAVGSPVAPSLATPRGNTAPAPVPRAAASPKPPTAAAPVPAAASTAAPAAVKAAPVAARSAAPVASAATPPAAPAAGQITAASAAQETVTEGPLSPASRPEASASRGAPPKAPVQIAVAPPAAAPARAVSLPLEPPIATAAPGVRAATAIDAVADAPIVARAATSISALPKARVERRPAVPAPSTAVTSPPKPAAPAKVAALPVRESRPLPAAPVTPPVASTAMPGTQVLALAPEAPKDGETEPIAAIASTPKPAAPVQVVRAPSAPTVLTAVSSDRGEVILHTVQPGEQLGSIAVRYGVPARAIARFNGLPASAEVAAGGTLRIPWRSALVLNDEPVYTDVPVVTEAGIPLAPFRAIVEHSGGSIWWIAASKQVRAQAFSRDIRVTIGSRVALVDASQYMLATETKMLRDRAMVPLGLFSDALGFKVTFDQGTGRFYLAAQ